MTTLTVHLERPDLVDDLVDSFHESGCAAHRSGPRSCTIEHASAASEHEARAEVVFFLRAWQARHGFARALLAP